jgi:hypothetical protein
MPARPGITSAPAQNGNLKVSAAITGSDDARDHPLHGFVAAGFSLRDSGFKTHAL